jgi:hypothetical protein
MISFSSSLSLRPITRDMPVSGTVFQHFSNLLHNTVSGMSSKQEKHEWELPHLREALQIPVSSAASFHLGIF